MSKFIQKTKFIQNNIYSKKSISKGCPKHDLLFPHPPAIITGINDFQEFIDYINQLKCRCN